MRVLFLRTHTSDCNKYYLSIGDMHNVTTLLYDDKPYEQQFDFVDTIRDTQPDVIVYIGALEEFHKGHVLRPDILRRIRDIAPFIHLCTDGCEKVWREWLLLYDKQECFNLQVSIDGNFNTPIASMERGLVKLPPVPAHLFSDVPWNSRDKLAALVGPRGHDERSDLVSYLSASMDVCWFRDGSYASMLAFMANSKIVVNCPASGTGEFEQVKSDVIETGLVGACLFERKNAVISKWFIPGVEYIEYDHWKDAHKKVQWAKENDEAIKVVAAKFNERVMAKHHPRTFWKDVFDKAGVKQ